MGHAMAMLIATEPFSLSSKIKGLTLNCFRQSRKDEVEQEKLKNNYAEEVSVKVNGLPKSK
jgi:hypothetical protein